MVKPVVHTSPLNPVLRVRPRVQVINTEPSLTKQCFEDECNINKIMARYEKTGVIEHVKASPPQYGDFTDVDDYHGAMNRCLEIQSEFMALPATLRARFSNDPGEFIDFVRNPDNKDELTKLGLIGDAVRDVVQSLNTFEPEIKSSADAEGTKTA